MKEPMFSLTYRKAENNAWIQCFVCGLISHNHNDAANLWCEKCQFHHVNGIVEESSRLSPTPGDANREQKLIVALFLALGKVMKHVPKDENVEISEAEIREAWKRKESPVRIVSRDQIWGSGNVFKVVAEKMQIKNYASDLKAPIVETAKKGRAFDFDLE